MIVMLMQLQPDIVQKNNPLHIMFVSLLALEGILQKEFSLGFNRS